MSRPRDFGARLVVLSAPPINFLIFGIFFFFLILCLDRDRVIRGGGTKKSIAY